LKTLTKISIGLLLILFSNQIVHSKGMPQVSTQSDSTKLIELYSLFSEYHKNKDYKSALPYGWQVLEIDQKKFAKWIYYKMEDCLWWMHDSSDISIEEKTAIADTMPYFYNIAFENFPEAKPFFQTHKAFVFETWLQKTAVDAIKEYELAAQLDADMDAFYYNRLGQLYINNALDSNDYKEKAIELYSMLAEKYPDNPNWNTVLESLVENIDQLCDLLKKSWDLNPDDLAKAWKYAACTIKSNRFPEAIVALEFLVNKSPETINYWAQLATAYQKTEDLTKAETTFKKLIELEPDKKEHYLNLGIVYKDKGLLSQARTQYQKASEVGKGWALPIYYEGNLYEQSARACEYDFDAKLVFLLAVETYRKARNMDASLTMAQDRVNALSGAVPTSEDYFFRGFKKGDVIPINGKCSTWVGKSVTVP
jgi:tetratricopeptide (TPR) repeat protein